MPGSRPNVTRAADRRQRALRKASLPGVENYWAVAFANRTAGWLVGTDGRLLKIKF